MNDLTVIYYTNGREKPEFAAKIRETLLESAGGLPLISVSQQPMKFGENICVGNVGSCYHNVYRQMMIGIAAARTTNVCVAEADFVYPREYFEFVPHRQHRVYLAVPIYVLIALRGKVRVFAPKPKGHDCAWVGNREYVLSKFEEMFFGKPLWNTEGTNGDGYKNVIKLCKTRTFKTSVPCVTFKTDDGMHRKTPARFSRAVRELPGYGTAESMIARYLR